MWKKYMALKGAGFSFPLAVIRAHSYTQKITVTWLQTLNLCLAFSFFPPFCTQQTHLPQQKQQKQELVLGAGRKLTLSLV